MTDLNIRKEGRAGRITLTRAKALNALNHDMCLAIEAALNDWRDDPQVDLVMIDADGGKAFCAGGDIVEIYQEGLDGRDADARQFWRDEYRLNAMIASYPKPYVAFMDGIVMGGGVGLSAHGSHRIVTERTLFAMPECGIGLIPDVGGTYLLSRMPGACGLFVGLTGHRLSAADCLYGGLADTQVAVDGLEDLKVALVETGDVAVISGFAVSPDRSYLAEHQGEIDAVFGLETLEDITAALAGGRSPFAVDADCALDRGAPLSLRVTLGAIREARRHNSLKSALRAEFRFVSLAVLDGEFLEGIRAAVIDKDRTPKWKYPTPAAVPDSLIGRMFEPAPGGDLVL